MSETDLSESQRIKKYLQHQRRLELQRETVSSGDSQKVPQYILDARNEIESEVEVIYLSSDDEDELDKNYDSDDSFHTANEELEDMMEIDAGSNDTLSAQVEDSPNDMEVIEISSDDSDLEFLYEIPGYGSTRRKRDRRPKIASHTVREDTRLPDYVSVIEGQQILARRVPQSYRSERLLLKTCCYCGIITDSKDGLTRYVKQFGRPYCEGCFRFRTNLRGVREEEDVIRWFITGKHPVHDLPRFVGQIEFIGSLKRRRDFMKDRVLRHSRGDGSKLVTTAELYDLCVESDFRCVISGNYLYPGRKAYWALSLDHKIPIKDSGKLAMTWSKNNLQLMCHILNVIKGHFSDEMLIKWYTNFIQAKKSGM